jgi:hypothetical protein
MTSSFLRKICILPPAAYLGQIIPILLFLYFKMKPFSVFSILAAWAFACHFISAIFYTLEYPLPAGDHFISMTGNMVVPKHPDPPGYYYLWPGLQPPTLPGVYQNVLDGRHPEWWIASGYCCANPDLPWGNGIEVFEGDTVKFSNVKQASVWNSTLRRDNPEETVISTFALSELAPTQWSSTALGST